MKRPDCAGWHEPDPTCDGSESEAPCAYRSRCLALVELAGGREARSVAGVRAASRQYPEEALSRIVSRQYQMSRLKGRPLTSVRQGRSEAVVVHPRPVKFVHAFPVVDAIAARFARELGRRLIEEDRGPQIGDVYLRWLPGFQGRQVVLYDYTGVNPLGLWIARMNMSFKDPELSLKANCDQYDAALLHEPPNGVGLRQWKDVRPLISLTRIGPEHARDTGRWLADLHRAGLIGANPRPKAAETKEGTK